MATTASTSSTASAASTKRITGLVSGLDVDSLVKQLMKSERAPLDRLMQSRQLLEWKQSNYRDLNSKLLTLKTSALNMKLSTAYRKYIASSSNDSVVTATAGANASATAYTIDSVTSLAKASNIATANGQSISRDTSVVTGGIINTPINTTNNNTFKISYDGGAFTDITLDSGKVYDGTTPGGTLKDLVGDIQTKLDAALGADKVKVSLTANNNIQFTSNDYPTSGTPKTITLQQGDANDLLGSSALNFATNTTTKQIASTVKDMDLTESIYTNLQQHRFKNSEDFDWVVNGADQQTFGAAADNITSAVDFNATNVTNYSVKTTETESQTVSGSATNNITTSIAYNSANWSNVAVYVNGTKYTTVAGNQQSALGDNQAMVSDDGTGKLKITFKNTKDVGTEIKVDNVTNYTAVTGVAQSALTVNQVLVEDDGTGKAKLTFKNQMQAGTQINVDRHDFNISTSVYNQDGTSVITNFNVNAYTDSMSALMSKINTSSTAGVSAFYDTGTDKMVFTAKKTGNNNASGNDITLTGSFLTNAMQMTKYTEGGDAEFSINGLSTTRKENSFTVNGVTFNLKGTTSNPVTISISGDTDSIYNSIKAFVDAYNDTISSVNTKLTEERDRDYTPLTDDQKAEMSETDITKWETKAKAGLLNGDSTLSRVVDSMRASLYDQVSGVTNTAMNNLTDIGITTSNIYQDRGKLVIDESKLREAISENSDAVTELFTKASTAVDNSQKYEESGLAVRLYNNISDGIKNLTSLAGDTNAYSIYDTSSLGTQMTSLEKQITDMEDRLNEKETNYYSKFANLETALEKMNAQSSWMSQQLSGLNSNSNS